MPREEGSNEKPENCSFLEPQGLFGHAFPGYALEPIVESRLDDRKLPGVTHLLRRNGDAHVIAVIMLKDVTQLILAGQLTLPVTTASKP